MHICLLSFCVLGCRATVHIGLRSHISHLLSLLRLLYHNYPLVWMTQNVFLHHFDKGSSSSTASSRSCCSGLLPPFFYRCA